MTLFQLCCISGHGCSTRSPRAPRQEEKRANCRRRRRQWLDKEKRRRREHVSKCNYWEDHTCAQGQRSSQRQPKAVCKRRRNHQAEGSRWKRCFFFVCFFSLCFKKKIIINFFRCYFFYQTCFLSVLTTQQQRCRGLWEERLLRVQSGRRVGRPRLPHTLVLFLFFFLFLSYLFPLPSQQLTQPIPHSRIDVFHSLLTCRKVT